MTPQRRIKTSFITKLLLAAAVIFTIALWATDSKADAASLAVANRCPSSFRANYVSYRCFAAYPEAFYAAGYARSNYRLSWNVSCSGRSASGEKNVRGAFKLIVNQFTSPEAYRLMITNDVCKIDVVATRVAGSGTINMVLAINQNHPFPVHN